MHIYIDESGSFIAPSAPRSKMSGVAAVIVPSGRREKLFKEYVRLRKLIAPGEDEPKGSRLGEREVAAVLDLLRRHGARVQACVIDVGSHHDTDITLFKESQAAGLKVGLTPSHPEWVVKHVEALSAAILRLPNQLFVQAFATICLIHYLLRTVTLYYSQIAPRELGRFEWTVDAKGSSVTPYEQTWKTVSLPLLQQMSIQEPLAMLEGGNYQHFRRFDKALHPGLAAQISDRGDFNHVGIDIETILSEHFRFADSRKVPGLQLADIVASTITRAFNRSIQPKAWRMLGPLMINRGGSVLLAAMNPDPSATPGRSRVTLRSYHEYVARELMELAPAILVSPHERSLVPALTAQGWQTLR
jgi:hypothetical protein